MKDPVVSDWDCLWNVTFNYFYENFGEEGLIDYFKHLANSEYYEKIVEIMKNKGFEGVKDYWSWVSEDEGMVYEDCLLKNKYTLKIIECSAFKHFEEKGFKPFKKYCDYCLTINSELSKKSNLKYKNISCTYKGSCEHIFERI